MSTRIQHFEAAEKLLGQIERGEVLGYLGVQGMAQLAQVHATLAAASVETVGTFGDPPVEYSRSES